MLKYMLKRLLLVLPTLFFCILLTFILGSYAPGDAADAMLRSAGGDVNTNDVRSEHEYRRMRKTLGLDLPAFYLSLASLSECDTLHKIPLARDRQMLSRLTDNYANWPEIAAWYNTYKSLEYDIHELGKAKSRDTSLAQMQNILFQISSLSSVPDMSKEFAALRNSAGRDSSLRLLSYKIQLIEDKLTLISTHATPWKKYIPVLHFYGLNNRFHHYLSGILLHGDFGTSYDDKRPVWATLRPALGWTMLLNGVTIAIMLLVSIPLGMASAARKGKLYDRLVSLGLFMLYSLPGFWIATLLIIWLCGGDFLSLFPESGILDLPEGASLGQKIIDIAWHLVLPVFSLVYASFAFTTRQVRASMLNTLGQDFIRTARAKGVPEKRILRHHAFRNALLPVISILGGLLPGLISGSVIIEGIFSIPGAGRKTLDAISTPDFPIILATLILMAGVTIAGNLLADMLYALADPRITFSKKKTNAAG